MQNISDLSRDGTCIRQKHKLGLCEAVCKNKQQYSRTRECPIHVSFPRVYGTRVTESAFVGQTLCGRAQRLIRHHQQRDASSTSWNNTRLHVEILSIFNRNFPACRASGSLDMDSSCTKPTPKKSRLLLSTGPFHTWASWWNTSRLRANIGRKQPFSKRVRPKWRGTKRCIGRVGGAKALELTKPMYVALNSAERNYACTARWSSLLNHFFPATRLQHVELRARWG